MSIQEVGHKAKESIREYPHKNRQKHAEDFQESLMQNLKNREQGGMPSEAAKVKRERACAETAAVNGVEQAAETRMERTESRANVGVPGNAARIRISGLMDQEAVQAVEVRHMRYEESDHIEIAVTEGYTLKGKREGHQVYVEAKYEDGRLEAYRVDPAKVQKQTQQRIEQFALETAALDT